MKKRFFVAALMGIVCATTRAQSLLLSPPADALAFSDVTVIDPGSVAVLPHANVVVTGDRIAAMGVADKVKIPAGAQVINGTGKFLIPGLWDMHMHLSYVTEHAFPLLIANGVTGVCDMGGDLDQIDRWREEIGKGERIGPRIVRSGPVLDGPRTEEGKFRLTVANPDEGRKAVQSLKQRGVDFIKVYHFLSRDSYFAIADEAKKQRIPFAGHVPNGISPQEASEAGQRSLEHTAILLQSLMSLENKDGRTQKELTAQAFDALLGEKGTALYKTMAKKRTWHTPTLVVARSFLLRPELAAQSDARRKYVAAVAREHWEKNNPVPKNVSEADMAERKQALQRMFDVVGAMRRANVQMLAGTDPPTRDVFPGFSLHDELGLLVKAGLTPAEALRAATSNPARCLELPNSGGIAIGKFADLVLLDADPLADIENTKKIGAVVVAGKFLGREALDEMLAKSKAAVKEN